MLFSILAGCVVLLIDLEIVLVRLITRPVLESIVLPELSMILVLEVLAELRRLTPLLVFRPVLLPFSFALLPETVERVFRVEDLRDSAAVADVVLLAALLL